MPTRVGDVGCNLAIASSDAWNRGIELPLQRIKTYRERIYVKNGQKCLARLPARGCNASRREAMAQDWNPALPRRIRLVMDDIRSPDGPPDLSATSPVTARFWRQLQLLTYSLLLFVLLIYVLERFQAILQPLFVAVFIAYLINPLHQGLVAYRVPSILAYGLILFLILAILFGSGRLLYTSFEQIMERMPAYEEKLDKLLQEAATSLKVEGAQKMSVRDVLGDTASIMETLRGAVGTFTSFFAALAVTFVYLIFLIAEKLSLKQRLLRAFGDQRAGQMLEIADTVNRAVTQYLAVKTFCGLLAAVLSVIVLAAFGVDFYILWGFLMFLLNYIPYLGSLVAVALPIVLSFLQLEPLAAIVVTILLIAIQQVIGMFLEPRMAGRRLQVSPLLILLSLSFWGLLWGVVGMILAVPLLVLVKAILDNIRETRPLATLMANE